MLKYDQEEIMNDDSMKIEKNTDDRLKAGTVHVFKLIVHSKWCHLKNSQHVTYMPNTLLYAQLTSFLSLATALIIVVIFHCNTVPC